MEWSGEDLVSDLDRCITVASEKKDVTFAGVAAAVGYQPSMTPLNASLIFPRVLSKCMIFKTRKL
jgi:hypothetical protein